MQEKLSTSRIIGFSFLTYLCDFFASLFLVFFYGVLVGIYMGSRGIEKGVTRLFIYSDISVALTALIGFLASFIVVPFIFKRMLKNRSLSKTDSIKYPMIVSATYLFLGTTSIFLLNKVTLSDFYTVVGGVLFVYLVSRIVVTKNTQS